MKYRKYLTLSCRHILTQLYLGFNRVAVSSHEDGNGNQCLNLVIFILKGKVTRMLDKVLNAAACQGQATYNTVFGAG